MKHIISYGKQYIDGDDIRAVADVLKSDFITQGPIVKKFEDALCRIAGAEYAVAVNSGTSALHIACLAAGVSRGDEGITSSNSFLASANSVLYCGGRARFADIDDKTYNMDPRDMSQKLTRKTKVVIPVHFAGQPCDMRRIDGIVRKAGRKRGKKIWIIEDASHALGSLDREDPIGRCRYSDMTVFSFHPVKHITTGEGGAVLTNNKDVYEKLLRLRNHGISHNRGGFLAKGTDRNRPGYFEQIELGYNFRITDIGCALGISQLKKLPGFRKRRRDIVAMYNKAFRGVDGIALPYEAEGARSNFHLYVLLFDFESRGISRKAFMERLMKENIFTQVHYIPIHTHPFHRKQAQGGRVTLPRTEEYYKKCLSLPLYPAMSDCDVKRVISAVRKIWK